LYLAALILMTFGSIRHQSGGRQANQNQSGYKEQPMTDNRGGPRPGAGRPALPDQILTTFRLTAEQRAKLDALGVGNMNEGLRALVDGEVAAECLELRRRLAEMGQLLELAVEKLGDAVIEQLMEY